MRFQSKALAKLNRGDELDAPAELARPRSSIALMIVVALVVGGAVWAVTAEVPRTVTAIGILTHAHGSVFLQSPVSGQITGVYISQGNTFPAGTPLFRMQDRGRVEVVKAVTGGRATAVLGKLGQVVPTGADLAVVERIDGKNDPLVAVLYLPAANAGQISEGSPVDLVVQSAPAQEYGVLRGLVLSISTFAESRQQITEFVGDEHLGERFSRMSQPLKVVVSLVTGKTTSGYQWSTKSGPPYRIESRTLIDGAIHLAPIKPISWVVP